MYIALSGYILQFDKNIRWTHITKEFKILVNLTPIFTFPIQDLICNRTLTHHTILLQTNSDSLSQCCHVNNL